MAASQQQQQQAIRQPEAAPDQKDQYRPPSRHKVTGGSVRSHRDRANKRLLSSCRFNSVDSPPNRSKAGGLKAPLISIDMCSDDEDASAAAKRGPRRRRNSKSNMVAIDDDYEEDEDVIVNYPRHKRHSTGDAGADALPFGGSELLRAAAARSTERENSTVSLYDGGAARRNSSFSRGSRTTITDF